MDGFRCGRQIIYSAMYSLDDGRSLIVNFEEWGQDQHGRVKRADGKAVITTKPGEVVFYEGRPVNIVRVEPYRENGLPATQPPSSQ